MIKIPLNRAIELLEARLKELESSDTDIKAFKNRLLTDVEGIFGRGSSQAIAIISLDALHFDRADKLFKIKTTFRQTIQGLINHIKDFHIINQEIIELSEEEYKNKYKELLTKWNELVPEYNQLIKDYENIISKFDDSLSEIKILKDKLNQKSNIGDIIKILFLGASPIDKVKLRIDEELRDIEYGLKLATLRDSFELKSKWAITPKSLQQALLDESPSIVHFSGHGDINGIAVEDSLGNSKLIDTEAIGSLFELFSEDIKCVILNSCYSESQATEIAKHVPYVIGMKSSINDKSAITFSVGFYSALGAGKDIEFAFKMGIVAIKMEGVSGSDIPIMIG